MTTLHTRALSLDTPKVERREFRRHDISLNDIDIYQTTATGEVMMGQLVDISAGGIRIRGPVAPAKVDSHVMIRIELPNFAGISPFIERGDQLNPKQQWVGWVEVTRIQHMAGGVMEIGARLLDMDDMDRGMLGLYLSTQPLAA